MGDRLIFLYFDNIASDDGRRLNQAGCWKFLVQAAALEGEILGKSGVSLILRRDDDCLTSVKETKLLNATLPGKVTKHQILLEPYRKPTQVDEKRILRRLRELG